jgi:hypothetical protein
MGYYEVPIALGSKFQSMRLIVHNPKIIIYRKENFKILVVYSNCFILQ